MNWPFIANMFVWQSAVVNRGRAGGNKGQIDEKFGTPL